MNVVEIKQKDVIALKLTQHLKIKIKISSLMLTKLQKRDHDYLLFVKTLK